jgi:hypothetical protein
MGTASTMPSGSSGDFQQRAEDSLRREEGRLAAQQRGESLGGLWAPSPVTGGLFAAVLAASGVWLLNQDGNVGRGSGVPPELGWLLVSAALLLLITTAVRALRDR